MLRAFGCVSSYTILDGFNIENPDVPPDMNSGLVQDFQRQDMPDLTADFLEFRRMRGLRWIVLSRFIQETGYGGYRGLTGTFAFRAGRWRIGP